MTTIYAVNEGHYSDYHVVALFSTRERAQEFMATFTGDYGEIEEYALDSDVVDLVRQGYTKWLVHMLRDGTTEIVEQQEMRCSVAAVTDHHNIWHRSGALAYRGEKDVQDCLVSEVWARTAEHAVKIVNERRIGLIADGYWKQTDAGL